MKKKFLLASCFVFSFLQTMAQGDSTLNITGSYITVGASAKDFKSGNKEMAQLGFRPIPWAGFSFGFEAKAHTKKNIVLTFGPSFSIYGIELKDYSSFCESFDIVFGAGPYFPILKSAKKYKGGLLLQPLFLLSNSRFIFTKPSGIYSPNYTSYLKVKEESKYVPVLGFDFQFYWSQKVKNSICQGIGFSIYYQLKDTRWSMPAFQKYNTRVYFQVNYKFKIA